MQVSQFITARPGQGWGEGERARRLAPLNRLERIKSGLNRAVLALAETNLSHRVHARFVAQYSSSFLQL